MAGEDIGFFNNRPDHAVDDSVFPGQCQARGIAHELVQTYTTAQVVCLESRSEKVA